MPRPYKPALPRFITFAGVLLTPLVSLASEEDVATLAERCQACHVGGLALARLDTETLLERIGKVQGVPGQHAPLLQGADRALIKELAERLAAPDGD